MQRIDTSSRRGKQIVWTAAIAAIVGSASLVRAADVLIESFESGGFDYAGDTAGGVATTPLATTGVTDGTYSLRVTAPQNYWINLGLTEADPTVISANSILKFDVQTSTGVNFVPIFHSNPSLPADPGGGGWHQGPGLFVAANASPQTVTWDYSAVGIPAGATTMTLQLQGSTGNAVDFFIDNVRVGGALPTLSSGPAEWKTNGNGVWLDANNWDPAIPGASGSTATFSTFGGAITTASQIAVTVDSPVVVNALNFDKSTGGYRIAGGNTVNLAASVSANPTVNVISGSHVIAAPLNMNSGNTTFAVAAGASLTLDNLQGGSFGAVNKTGDGALSANRIVNVSLNVDGGVVNLASGNAQANGFMYGITVSNGATVNLNGASVRNNGLYTAGTPGTIDLGTGGVLTTGMYGGSTFFGVIAGAGSVVVGGESANPQTMNFGGLNTYSGTTTVTNGDTLQVGSSAHLGNESATNYVVLDNGILQAVGSFSTNRKVSIAVAGGTIDTNGYDVGVGVIDPGPLNKSGTGTLTVTRLENLPAVSINDGTLKVAANATAAGTSKVTQLFITPTARLDLSDNKLISATATGTWTGTGYDGLSGLVDKGRGDASNAQWDGLGGIVTSDSRAVNNNDLVSIGTAKIGAIKGIADAATTTFSGQTVLGSDSVAMVTWGGDANLDGKINIDDYGQIDFNVSSSGSVFGWYNGDFNYDGKINIDDYGIIDFNVSAQNGIFPTGGGGIDGVAAVPEPGAAFVLMAAGAAAFRRRARRG